MFIRRNSFSGGEARAEDSVTHRQCVRYRYWQQEVVLEEKEFFAPRRPGWAGAGHKPSSFRHARHQAAVDGEGTYSTVLVLCFEAMMSIYFSFSMSINDLLLSSTSTAPAPAAVVQQPAVEIFGRYTALVIEKLEEITADRRRVTAVGTRRQNFSSHVRRVARWDGR